MAWACPVSWSTAHVCTVDFTPPQVFNSCHTLVTRQTMVCGRLTPELLAWLTLGIWFACWPMAYGAEPTIRASVVGRNGVLLLVVDTEVRRLLLADEVILGAEYVAEWARDQAAFSGMALMQTVAFLDPPPSAVLALGLGSGTVPAFLRDRSSACSDSSS